MIPRWMFLIAIVMGLYVSGVFAHDFFVVLPEANKDVAFPCFDLYSCSSPKGAQGTSLLVFAVLFSIATGLFVTLALGQRRG